MSTRPSKSLFVLACALAVSACGLGTGHTELTELPPPAAVLPAAAPLQPTGSLWMAASGQRLMLAEDRRARQMGDILTVQLVERVQAEKSASQDSQRNSSRSMQLSESGLTSWIPDDLFSGGASSSFSGSGSTKQQNRLSGEMTVVVVGVLPNGVLSVSGDRQITLTRGQETLRLTGLVRPEDISPNNRVASTRIANARVQYTGKGEMADQVRQGWLSRFFDMISPF